MSTRIRTALALAAALVAGGAFYASRATATPAVTTLTSAAGASGCVNVSTRRWPPARGARGRGADGA